MPSCPEPGICVEECSADGDCPFGQRCCFNGCGHECTGPKPGSCHSVPSTYVCHTLCDDDYDCPGMKKCCSHRCGRYCKEPVFLQAAMSARTDFAICIEECIDGDCPDGSCGRLLSTYVCHKFCDHDADCPGRKKCCPHRCGRYCKEPIIFE
ncbi:antileukoproteinase-like [Nematolebias whitei]|uniref:antileukoproteinase-like n=1 Tax=Nematolebias whitei TaxID=451745 RepID=UPI00189ABDF6|nr:antileukoproteinase-like [Nematolebias whitei]